MNLLATEGVDLETLKKMVEEQKAKDNEEDDEEDDWENSQEGEEWPDEGDGTWNPELTLSHKLSRKFAHGWKSYSTQVLTLDQVRE